MSNFAQAGVRRLRSGFTLVEMMVAIAVLAIGITIAVPSFSSTIDNSRLTSAASESLAILQDARLEAIKSRRRTVVCLSSDPNAITPVCSTSYSLGWIAFSDADKDGVFDVGERLLRAVTVPKGVQMLGSTAFSGGVVFHPDGFARTSSGDLLIATVDMCLPISAPQLNVRHVSIASGSRISIRKASTGGACNSPGDAP